MRSLITLAIAFSVVAIYMMRPDNTPTDQTVVNVPPAELYASLDQLYSDIERKAAVTQTVTGTPPIPVKFSFDRDHGEMLSMIGEAGFRTVQVKAWIEEAPEAGKSLLKVQFEPASLMDKSGERDAYSALKVTLKRTSKQFVEGRRITALFGEGRSGPSDAENTTSWEEMQDSRVGDARGR